MSRPRAAIKAAPTFPGFHFRQAISRRLYVGAGAHTSPGAGRWPGKTGRCGHRPLQRSVTRAAPAAAPTFPGFHFRQAISRRLYVGTGAHTRQGWPVARRDGPMWASAPTKVCYAGGSCGRPYISGVPFPAGYLTALVCRGGCPHPPGAGRWPGKTGLCGHRPIQSRTYPRLSPYVSTRRGGPCGRPRQDKPAPTSRPADKIPASGGMPGAGVPYLQRG